jgi:cell division protein FtsQ
VAEEPKAAREGVPDVVLEELLAAFSEQIAAEAIDFDDPSIDRMLGIGVDDDDDVDASLDGDVDSTLPSEATDPLTPSVTAENTVALNPERKVIVIGADDDDRPDAVYLDEESGQRLREVHSASEDSGGRSTIIIQDLDEGGSIEALPARSSGSMDPRVRARRIAVRRAKGRKRLIWVAIGAAILLVLVGAVAVLASSMFDVRTVDVQGAVYTDPQQLSAIVDALDGDAILLVDTRKVEQQLETIPWVESARVSTHFPHRVFIDIRERKPIATFVGSDGRYRVIDRDGRVLDVVEGIPIDYMLVTGANPDVEQGQFAGRPFASAAQLTIALPAEIRALTESIGIDATAGNITLQLRDDIEVQLGAPNDLSTKLARLLSEVRGGLDGLSALDVSTSEILRTPA